MIEDATMNFFNELKNECYDCLNCFDSYDASKKLILDDMRTLALTDSDLESAEEVRKYLSALDQFYLTQQLQAAFQAYFHPPGGAGAGVILPSFLFALYDYLANYDTYADDPEIQTK